MQRVPVQARGPAGVGLGELTIETFMSHAHSESVMDCHMGTGKHQCAGAAIYRANVCKLTRHPEKIMSLPADHEKVFSSPIEFTNHHMLRKKS